MLVKIDMVRSNSLERDLEKQVLSSNHRHMGYPCFRCNPESRACELVDLPDGTPCSSPDGQDFDACHEGFGVCRARPEPGTFHTSGFGSGGKCVAVPKPEGTPCDDNNECSVDDKCTMAGEPGIDAVCLGLPMVGTPCEGHQCTVNDTCVLAEDGLTSSCQGGEFIRGMPCTEGNLNGTCYFYVVRAPGPFCLVTIPD